MVEEGAEGVGGGGVGEEEGDEGGHGGDLRGVFVARLNAEVDSG